MPCAGVAASDGGTPACARAARVILRAELAHALTAAPQAQRAQRRKRGRDTEEEEEAEEEDEGEEGAASEGARGAGEPGSPGPAAGAAAGEGPAGAGARGRGAAHRYTLRDRSQHQVDFFKPGADDERARCGRALTLTLIGERAPGALKKTQAAGRGEDSADLRMAVQAHAASGSSGLRSRGPGAGDEHPAQRRMRWLTGWKQ